MYYKLTCTEEQFNNFISKESKRYRRIGLAAIGTVIVSGVLRKMGFYLEEVAGYIVPNILGVWVFSGIIYWAVGSIYIFSERNKMRESYVLYDESSITYHMLKSRDSVGRLTQEYHTYYITSIDRVVEGAYYYTVYGNIVLTINRNSHEKSRKTYKVKIPKYFEGLDKVLGDFYKKCRQ